ncbi:Insulin-like receptor-like 2, partial [Homarus americanus]
QVLKHRCVDREMCLQHYAVKADTRECVELCPLGYTETTEGEGTRNVTKCVPCKGFVCPKTCDSTVVKSISHAQLLRGCTIIQGNLTIHINGGEDIEEELEKNLSGIEEITGYVKIFRSNSTNLTINKGKVFVQSNPKLCLHHIEDFINNTNITGLSETDVSSTSNGDKVPCNVTPLNASVSQSSLYGTLRVTVAASPLPFVTVYYVNFKKADKNISIYESEGPCSDQGWSTMEMDAGNSTGGTITGSIVNLEPYTRYAVYVKTYSLASSAKGAQSEVLYAVTSPYNNSSSLEVWWQPPRRPNGVIDHYLVTLTLLLDTLRIPPDLDFCNQQTREYVDKRMKAPAVAEASSIPVRKTPRIQEQAEEEMPAVDDKEGSCTATPTPTCCACQDAGVGVDQEVMGQIGFEDFMMDTVYVKNILALLKVLSPSPAALMINRSRRSTHEKLLVSDEEFEAKLRATHQPTENTFLKNGENSQFKDASTFSEELGSVDVFTRPFLDPEAENEEFPLHQDQKVHEFPTHAGIHEHYQPHLENLTQYNTPHPQHSSVLLHQEHMTRETRLGLHNLHHYSIYSVAVKACQAPVNMLSVDPNGRLVHQGKLCSTVPARVAAQTRPSGVADQVAEGSLRAVSMMMERCVTGRDFEAMSHKVELPDLSPGNYSVQAQEEDSATRTWVVIMTWTVIVVMAGLLVATSMCWYWRRYTAAHIIPHTLEKVDINPYYREGFAPSEIFQEEFIFWRDDLKVMYDRPLGHGFFGMVFEGLVNRCGQQTRVAVKTHNERASTEEIRQFLKEAALMQNITCHHVVRLLGVVGDYSPVFVVMELMQEGDLKTFLRKHPPNFLTGQMAVEAADGMAYLAAGKLVHRDLAARNCMLDNELTLKIGDFGLTRNLKSDYYRKVIRLVVERYATLSRPRNCPKPLQRVMRRCWSYEARERPSFLAIIKYLLKYTSHDYTKRGLRDSFYHRSSDYSRVHLPISPGLQRSSHLSQEHLQSSQPATTISLVLSLRLLPLSSSGHFISNFGVLPGFR